MEWREDRSASYLTACSLVVWLTVACGRQWRHLVNECHDHVYTCVCVWCV